MFSDYANAGGLKGTFYGGHSGTSPIQFAYSLSIREL